jgi:hypothetical protein
VRTLDWPIKYAGSQLYWSDNKDLKHLVIDRLSILLHQTLLGEIFPVCLLYQNLPNY